MYHFTKKPLHYEDIKKIKQNKFNLKPAGLWLSKENEWLDFCLEEGFHYSKQDIIYKYNVQFNQNRMCIINTIQKVKELNEKYNFTFFNKKFYINWDEMSKDYDGIIFDNYKEIRQIIIKDSIDNNLWFLGIDVNCAVIWNIECITSFIEEQ